MFLLLGVLAVQWWPALPRGTALLVLLVALVVLAAVAARWSLTRPAAWMILGIGWSVWCGASAMQARLPVPLEGQDLVVVGRVLGLPDPAADATRFQLQVLAASQAGRPVPLRGRVQLAWYDDAPPLAPCERWQLRLRLKRPRSMLDPGGADTERSALQRGVVAVGYVREDPANKRLGRRWCIHEVRARLAQGIELRVPDRHDAALLRALALGDVRGLDPDDWSVARANGVSHLLAISGFHVGVAAAFGAWGVIAIYALWPALALRCPRVQAQAGGALTAAVAYGALAGMGLPTMRTLLMIAVVVAARGWRRHVRAGHGLALAMLVLLLSDPLAVLSAGFWLSFVGVAFLILCLTEHAHGLRGIVKGLTTGQWVMTLALLPLSLWFFGQTSLVGGLSNLVAVPVVSFVLVPLALLGVLALVIWPPFAVWPLSLAAHVAHGQWWLLQRIAAWPGASCYLPSVSVWALVLGMLGALWLLAPRGIPTRWLGAMLFLPLLWPQLPRPAPSAFEAWVLDVGQGLSVVVRTRGHTLVYDTGARYPSGFDIGAAAVVPSLHALGVRRLDMLVVSHADNDHAGGAGAVLAAYAPGRRLAGEPRRMPSPMAGCHAGQAWTWDGVRFSVLGPLDDTGAGNDRSCVLLVDGGADRLLLTGDITSRVESAVAAALPSGGSVVMTVPHHGSMTSSSEPFLTAVAPSLAVVSAGWRNRFRHPRPLVVARYGAAGVPLLNTATAGAIQLSFPARGHARVVRQERQRQARYWREK
ncbi:DNA internalization-related competence protein ComEC/Rec2 [Dyella sp.]|uniref:DNA internalization-related competence protein ComEC/Rec2 n=1 Tax=Dyella sp. TaxID=1869338 RepID=UPI002D78C3BF|nr:DNA internalization-related competence protein ComEC/Rec2 [Dyella sp.]HET6433456.1 DNA internalization-related competence protein ComEC/Rec2 [Dyella sp.]